MKNWMFITIMLLILLPAAGIAQDDTEMSAEQAAMMQAWIAAGTPGEPHQRLAEQAGTWNAVVETWMQPGGEPEISESTVDRSMTLDGRVLEEQWSGSMMGMPFNGHGRTGYDNVARQYWSTWTDNMSTGLMLFQGHHDSETGTFEFTGSYLDPITGKTVQSRSVTTMTEAGTEEMVMFESADGEETMTMRMTLTRQ